MRMRNLISAGFVAGAVLLSGSTLGAPTFDRTAEEILADLAKVELPTYDRSKANDEAYRQQYMTDYNAALEKQAEFILELYKAAPEHPEIERLLPRRWSVLQRQGDVETLSAELDDVIERFGDSTFGLNARFQKANAEMTPYLRGDMKDPAKAREIAEKIFISHVPDDERGARLLSSVAESCGFDSPERVAIYQEIDRKWGETRGGKYAAGKVKQVTGLNKPFELEFEEASTGQKISMKDLRGKVVVIDFWATWCGPCIAEMPKMKDLYKSYHSQGVEFIGVSLDQPLDKGGLERLRAYVKDNEIPWPQYYQGNYWDSEFSVSWGINSIPALFIVDKEGNLRSVQARGKLETLIPELLAE